MANYFLDKVNMATVIATAFDPITVKPLRPKYVFDALAYEKTWDLNKEPRKGDKVSFPMLTELSANTGALHTTATSIAPTQKTSYTRRTASLSPYGDHLVLDTFESGAETFVNDVADAGWSLADQAMNSLNLIARNALDLNKFRNEASGTLSGTSHMYGSYTSTLGPLKAKTVRAVVARFRANKVQPYSDGFYRGVIDEKQYTQLRADSGAAGWSESMKYVDNSPFAVGEMGDFEKVRFIIANETKVDGSTYSAYFMGQGALGKAIGRDVGVYADPKLHGPQQNLMLIHWNALIGYRTVHREASIIVSTTGVTR